jgi:acyl transferase domain-containing protein
MSNVTGDWVTESEATDPHYWARHLRQTVRFGGGLEKLLSRPGNVLLEVGPGRTLTALAKRGRNKSGDQVALSSLPGSGHTRSDHESLLNTLGRLWLEGVEVDWHGFNANETSRRIALPTYPFERKRYWVEMPESNVRSDNTGRELPGISGRPEPAATQSKAARAPETSPRLDARPQAAPNQHKEQEGMPVRRASRERIMKQQLEIISLQLDLLRKKHSARRS